MWELSDLQQFFKLSEEHIPLVYSHGDITWVGKYLGLFTEISELFCVILSLDDMSSTIA